MTSDRACRARSHPHAWRHQLRRSADAVEYRRSPETRATYDIAVKCVSASVDRICRITFPQAPLYARNAQPVPPRHALQPHHVLAWRAYLRCKGGASDPARLAWAFLQSYLMAPSPDVRLTLQRRADDGASLFLAVPKRICRRLFPAAPWCCGRESRGHIKLASADPKKPVRIRRCQTTGNDWERRCAPGCASPATSVGRHPRAVPRPRDCAGRQRDRRRQSRCPYPERTRLPFTTRSAPARWGSPPISSLSSIPN